MTRKFDFEMPKSLTEIVASRLRQAIVDGEFALGEMISEDTLAALFGVSRTPVRDALTLLQNTGLVEIRPKRGSFVFQPSEDDMRAICDFRVMLEVQAARCAHRHDHDGVVKALQAGLDEMQAAMDADDDVRYGHADSAFHLTLFLHSGNSYLHDAYDLVAGKIAALRTAMSRQFSDAREVSLAEHRAVMDFVDRGDFAGLEDLLRVHIDRTVDAYRLAVDSGRIGTPARTPRLQRIQPTPTS